MWIYITSTSEDLTSYRRAACEVVAGLGGRALLRPTATSRAFDSLRSCMRQVAAADVVLAIVGWRQGPLPADSAGGRGRPWTAWEVRSAFERGVPVVVMMASELWGEREDDVEARAVVEDLRGELGRLATFFGPGIEGFRELLKGRLAEHFKGAPEPATDVGIGPGLRLRRWPPPELPERPYPVLLPITHPDLLAGRGPELQELRSLIELPTLVTGVYAVSGTGKSSFLFAGLVRALRLEGKPATLDRHPCEAGIVGRLLRDLVDGEALDVDDEDSEDFVEKLVALRRLVDAPPVLVLDQFEDVLRRPDARRARAVLGGLLAASAQRVAGLDGPPCRWVLAYRQEFHGDVFLWLGDVLQDAGAAGVDVAESLPRDLSGPERFQIFPLAPLGTPSAGVDDVGAVASRSFLDAIEKPLRRFPAWHFGEGGAGRLARAFGEARARRPEAPLVPELQVVLAHLLEHAETATGEGGRIEVPEEAGELIEEALEDHLRRALDVAFPIGSEGAKTLRTRAILALRELADAQGRRDTGVAAAPLARAIGVEGADVLEQMATARARLVVPQRRAGELTYLLSHDRLAEVLVRLVDEGQYARLGVDRRLLGLRRFVELQSKLFQAGEAESATEVSGERFAAIAANREALLWGEERESWWRACVERRRASLRRRRLRGTVTALVLLVVAFGVWAWADRRERLEALFEEVVSGDPEPAFAAANRLLVEWEIAPEKVREALRRREVPFDPFDRGIGGVALEDGQAEAVLRLAEVVLPLIVEDAPEDPVRIASLVWALDFFAPKDVRRLELRDRALEPLRRTHPPPPEPEAGDPAWAEIPAGTFWMGAGPAEGRSRQNDPIEFPRHRVTLSAFRLGIYKVTNAEYRRLVPKHAEGQEDQLPVGDVTWHEAYTYAAWLGGRLPTEAEAEYVRRGGCDFLYCKRDGSEAVLDEVAWWAGNATDPETGEVAPRPVGLLEPTPWGLYDLYGNGYELCADWVDPYGPEEQRNPPGSTRSWVSCRVTRGTMTSSSKELFTPSYRWGLQDGMRLPSWGLRILRDVNDH